MYEELPNEGDSGQVYPSLVELEIVLAPKELSLRAREFLRDGRSRYPQVNCFDFVPSNYENAWTFLNNMARGSFCEWGSGHGIVVGLAEILGFQASGIEIDPELAEASRGLLRDHNMKARISTGSYLDSSDLSDYYYVYSWASQISSVEKRFSEIANDRSKLLICYGQDELKCMVPRSRRNSTT